MLLKTPVQGREIWLDGLRGLAAVVVAFFHLTVDIMRLPYRSYWDEPAQLNRRWFQLAPFRLLFCGQAMVRIFFVISGYSVSISIIRRRERDNNGLFYHSLTSSVFRRVIRLYFPVLVVCIFSHILFYIGAYRWDFTHSFMEGCEGAVPWSATWPHLKCMGLTMMSSMSLVRGGRYYTRGLNGQLWSMADELRGSIAVYMVLLSMASAAPRARVVSVAAICSVLLWCGLPHTTAFISGHLFAELDLWRRQTSSIIPTSTKTPIVAAHNPTWWKQGLALAALSLGIHFLCLPVLPDFPVNYWFRLHTDPLPLWEGPFVRINGWHSVGSILLIWALRHLPLIRKLVLETRPVQFLGKISFSFYLFHLTFIRVLRNPILHYVCTTLTGKNVYVLRDEGQNDVVYYFAWFVAVAVIMPLAVVTSVYATKVVDRFGVNLSHSVERKLSGR